MTWTADRARTSEPVSRYVLPPCRAPLDASRVGDVDVDEPERLASIQLEELTSGPTERHLPAVPEAERRLSRAAEDHAAATAARARYRTEAPPKLQADQRLARLLEQGEWLIAFRTSAVVDRRRPRGGDPKWSGMSGQLAVTSRRLILMGRHVLAFELADVQEIVLSGDRLLVIMNDGAGVAVDVDQPRLFRVEIAAARATARH